MKLKKIVITKAVIKELNKNVTSKLNEFVLKLFGFVPKKN